MKTIEALLSAAGGAFVSGESLARNLGISRAAVHKRIDSLRRQGYGVEGVPRRGYRVTSVVALDSRPSPGLFQEGWGRPFFHAVETGSTQEDLKRRALDGTPEGALSAADRQSAGRGRMGRRWESPPGGLWYSLLLRPALSPAQVPALTLVAALCWVKVLRKAAGVDARLKWPNDVWVGEKKLLGLLADMSSETDRVHWLVLGVGLNVNNAPPPGTAVPATSLQAETAREWDRWALLVDWMAVFRAQYGRFVRAGFRPFLPEARRFSLLDGRAAQVELPTGPARVRVVGIDADGRLRVRGPRGEALLSAGEVHFLPG